MHLNNLRPLRAAATDAATSGPVGWTLGSGSRCFVTSFPLFVHSSSIFLTPAGSFSQQGACWSASCSSNGSVLTITIKNATLACSPGTYEVGCSRQMGGPHMQQRSPTLRFSIVTKSLLACMQAQAFPSPASTQTSQLDQSPAHLTLQDSAGLWNCVSCFSGP